MAISILTQGGNGTQTVLTNLSQSVTLSAGAGNRRMFVVIGAENTSPTAVTYGGNALALVTDGTTTCDQSTDAIAYIAVWTLRESQMPANGARTLAVTFSGSGNDVWMYWYICDGVDQTTNVRSVSVGEVSGAGAAGTTISATSPAVLNSNDTNALLIAGGYKNTNTGTLTLSAPASSTTDESSGDTPTAGSGLRVSAAHKLGSIGTGSITTTYTLSSSQARRAIVAMLVNPSAVSGPSISSAAFAAQSATMAATAVRGHPISSAAFAAQSATMAATAVRGHPISSAAFNAGSATMAATAKRGHPVSSAAFAAGSATMAATAVRGHPVSSAAFAAGSATLAATVSVGGGRVITAAAFAAGSASFAATASVATDRGTGRGTASVFVPDGACRVQVSRGTSSVRVPGE